MVAAQIELRPGMQPRQLQREQVECASSIRGQQRQLGYVQYAGMQLFQAAGVVDEQVPPGKRGPGSKDAAEAVTCVVRQ